MNEYEREAWAFKRVMLARESVSRMQGKLASLKHENNKLRAKIARQEELRQSQIIAIETSAQVLDKMGYAELADGLRRLLLKK